MKLYKLSVITAILLLSLPAFAQNPYPIEKIEADSIWKRIDHFRGGSDFYSTQEALLKYREEGLKFWKMFPNDDRRYKWLFETARRYSGYLLYLSVNKNTTNLKSILSDNPTLANEYSWPFYEKKLKDWESIYPQLKKEFFAYCNKNPNITFGLNSPGFDPELTLLVGELWSFLELSLNKQYRSDQKIDVNKLKNLFIAITRILDKERSLKRNNNWISEDRKTFYDLMGCGFIDRYNEYRLDVDDIKEFLNSIIQAGSNSVAQNWAMQRKTLFALREEPLSFKHISTHGNMIDLEQLRGKVVLVDFWSTNCSSCIARMPVIKAVYNKYKSEGFEVISACLANEDLLDSIKKIENKIGADWPTLLIGKTTTNNSLGQQIWRKYGFWGVPQLLLLDRQGKLVMLNNKLRNGDFEPLVKQLLAKKHIIN